MLFIGNYFQIQLQIRTLTVKKTMDNIDSIDLQILKHLQENSNINIKELASKLFLTVTPVYERIKRLERDGYIMKYVALLNKKKLNLGMTVFCNVRLKEHAKNVGSNFVKDIVALPEIIECYNIAGDYDFMLKILVEDMSSYQDFVMNKLSTIENIGNTQSVFVMGEIKHSKVLAI
nr:Lrp/AsnC family transcriptional regulator [uncultured Flavobacterium sp.]